ncbi:MAG: hypothetical protein V3T70_00330, partial [Phycisphaerae bacterium]
FGLRTPTHTTVDVRLPSRSDDVDSRLTDGTINVLPPAGGPWVDVRGYVSPATYRVRAAGKRLEDVTVRATLKEFAGRWQGELSGQLEARLFMQSFDREGRGRMEEFVAPGVIRNNLGVDLHGCLLLETSGDYVRQAFDVRCFRVGDEGRLRNGEEYTDFESWYRKQDGGAAIDAGVEEGLEFHSRLELPHLNREMEQWARALRLTLGVANDARTVSRALESVEKQLLLLSTYSVLNPANLDRIHATIQRGGGRSYDCMHQLNRRAAILIGFSDQPGPATLEVNGRPLRATKSLTMYRFLIPIERR